MPPWNYKGELELNITFRGSKTDVHVRVHKKGGGFLENVGASTR